MSGLAAAETLAFAERFIGAIESGDVSGVRACYAPNAVIWHNTEDVEQTVEQNIKVLEWFMRALPDRHSRLLSPPAQLACSGRSISSTTCGGYAPPALIASIVARSM